MTEIKNIIFDFGEVIINVRTELLRNAMIEKGATNLEELHKHLINNGYYFKLETGEVSPQQFRNEVRKIAGEHLTDQEINDSWNAMIQEIPPDREQLLRKLKNKYRLFLLSNTNAIHYDYYQDYFRKTFGYEMNDMFEKAYYSHSMGLRKPDPDIYRMVINDSGIVPGESIFIDDREDNIHAANSIGIRGFFLKPGVDITELFDESLHFIGKDGAAS